MPSPAPITTRVHILKVLAKAQAHMSVKQVHDELQNMGRGVHICTVGDVLRKMCADGEATSTLQAAGRSRRHLYAAKKQIRTYESCLPRAEVETREGMIVSLPRLSFLEKTDALFAS